ncbi:MAG: proline--tRNA ligase [Nanoarchaeota archaeon]|nr:proline--tRNA ligase [Nanoarchaeota archaeon]
MEKTNIKFRADNVKLGFILVGNIHVAADYRKLEKEEKDVFSEIKEKYTLESLSKDMVCDSFRKLYWSYGMDPTKTRISSEALVRRIIKGENMWNVNNIVDSLNLLSAKSRLPLGYIDASAIKGDIIVRKAEKNEIFVKIGGSKLNCQGNEICVADDEKIIDYGFATSDSDLTKVTEKTKKLLILIYATAEIEDSYIEGVKSEVKKMLKKITPHDILEEGIAHANISKQEVQDKKGANAALVRQGSDQASSKPAAKAEKRQTLGITAKKAEDPSEWYTQVIQKAELADYSLVSGCIVFMPNSYSIWEKIQYFLDQKFKKSGVKNAYFPMFIPESLLTREKEHVEGFTPEVAWVTHAGDSKLAERLAVRPTSETIMYDSYAKWIRSHNDLPLRLNQWNSVVRWEFKNPVPFLRTREFLWQEGHTVFATKEEADREVLEILDYYAQAYEEMLAVPVIKGTKTAKEKFAGALYTTSIETFLPVGKAIQASTSHCLGQNFSKAFGITFLDAKGEKQFAWQNSWGFTTRSIGTMVMMHGDDKGLVLPPNVANIQVAIVPILFEATKDIVLEKAHELKKHIKARVELDTRDYSPGWKYSDWELKGVPLRIELGPKDVEKGSAVLARRDTGEKLVVSLEEIPEKVKFLLEQIQKDMLERARKNMDNSMVHVKTWDEFVHAAKNRRWILAFHCGDQECEEKIKEETEGVKATNIPFSQPRGLDPCVKCGKLGKYQAMFAKSY